MPSLTQPAQTRRPHCADDLAVAGQTLADAQPAVSAHALAALAVVIPVGPSDDSWPALLSDLSGLPPGAQICLVGCAASTLVTPDARLLGATRADVQWRLVGRGRALQQNAGARATTNPWLWFLHADSRLGPATLNALARVIKSDDGDGIGYFDLAFHDGPALMRVNACGAWLRSRVLGLPFGDQGLFMPRAAFERLRGFDERCARGEDHAMIWQAKRLGIPLRAAGAPLYTSARKYAEHGWLTMTARHVAMTWQQARVFSRHER